MSIDASSAHNDQKRNGFENSFIPTTIAEQVNS